MDRTDGGGSGDLVAAGGPDAGSSIEVGDGSASAPACIEKPTPLRTTGQTLALSVTPQLGGAPFRFGEANAFPGGGAVTPLNFRFYVSQVALLPASGAPVPVDLVTASGALEPYGIHLFNLEDGASTTLRVLAPPGSYVGLTFTLGIDDACNGGTPAERSPPLTDSSQMTWPHLSGYLFLRYEAQIDDRDAGIGDAGEAGASVDGGASSDAGVGTSALPPFIHMGGLPGAIFAPTATVRHSFDVANQPVARTVTLDIEQIYAGALAPVPPASLVGILPFPEVIAGEHLRQHVPTLALFELTP